MSKPTLESFAEDTETTCTDVDVNHLCEPEMKFYATGADGKVIKLHNRIASIPIGFGGKEFQKALETQMADYSDVEIMALAPFEIVGRGIAGIDEMAKSMDDNRVLFGLLQIQIGEGTFARYKNIFIHFQGEKMKILARARANKRLAAAKELIGHSHAPLVVSSGDSFTVQFVFNELKRIFVSDSIHGYQSSGGTQQDINSLRIDYQKRMDRAKLEAQEQQKRLIQERLRLEREAKEKALEEEKRRLEELKREAERQKMELELEKKRRAEEERRLRHEKEEKERLERKRLRQEEEEKELRKAMEENPNTNIEELKVENKKKLKQKRKKRKRRKKKDNWGDDKPWTPQRVLSAIHAPMSPVNWGLFKPSQKEVIAVKWGHGSLNELREELKDDEVQYGLMRLSFGSGRFRRSHWIFFLWTPDTMSSQYKKNNKRMKHVSYNGAMQRILKPWTVSLTVESKEKVTITEWILRVKRVVVVDGDEELTEEAFRKALQDENKYIAELKAKEARLIEKQKEDEEQKKLKEMEEAARKREEASLRKQSNLYTRVELNKVDSNQLPDVMTPTVDKDGNYYFNHEVDYEEIQAQAQLLEKEREIERRKEREKMKMEVAKQMEEGSEEDEDEAEEVDSSEEEREPSPEPVIELTEEELARIEEERKEKEAEEMAKRTQNEMQYRYVLQSKMVLESVELVKRTGEKLCWILFAPRD